MSSDKGLDAAGRLRMEASGGSPMITYSSDETIARPAGDIFPWLIEPEKQAQWSDVPMQPLTEGPLRQGSRMRLTFGRGPLHATLDLEFTSLESAERLAFTTVSRGGIHWEAPTTWRRPKVEALASRNVERCASADCGEFSNR
jgi:hypothetical protein